MSSKNKLQIKKCAAHISEPRMKNAQTLTFRAAILLNILHNKVRSESTLLPKQRTPRCEKYTYPILI